MNTLTNVQKLELWFEAEKAKGLIDVKFTVNPNMQCTNKEELAEEMLDMIEASNDSTRCTEITKL